MKKLIYYITDHGRGHASRSVALIRELQNLGIDIVIRNSNVVDFLQKSLPRAKIIDGITDVAPSMNSNGITIDEKKSKNDIINWIDRLDYFARQEVDLISKYEPNLIISDISVMPILAAEKKNINSIAISNFSWFDVLKFLPSDKLEILKDIYDTVKLTIQLPIGTKMDHFREKRKIGLISRIPTISREKMRQKLGINESDIAILFALGKSHVEVSCKEKENIKILSMNTVVKNSNHIPLHDWIEGQDVVAASDLVICKCGYGVISECLTNGVPFCYISDDNHLEQKAMSEELSSIGLMNRITFDDIKEFEINGKYEKIVNNPVKEPLDNHNAVKIISEFLKN